MSAARRMQHPDGDASATGQMLASHGGPYRSRRVSRGRELLLQPAQAEREDDVRDPLHRHMTPT